MCLRPGVGSHANTQNIKHRRKVHPSTSRCADRCPCVCARPTGVQTPCAQSRSPPPLCTCPPPYMIPWPEGTSGGKIRDEGNFFAFCILCGTPYMSPPPIYILPSGESGRPKVGPYQGGGVNHTSPLPKKNDTASSQQARPLVAPKCYSVGSVVLSE